MRSEAFISMTGRTIAPAHIAVTLAHCRCAGVGPKECWIIGLRGLSNRHSTTYMLSSEWGHDSVAHVQLLSTHPYIFDASTIPRQVEGRPGGKWAVVLGAAASLI